MECCFPSVGHYVVRHGRCCCLQMSTHSDWFTDSMMVQQYKEGGTGVLTFRIEGGSAQNTLFVNNDTHFKDVCLTCLQNVCAYARQVELSFEVTVGDLLLVLQEFGFYGARPLAEIIMQYANQTLSM
jgi:hypothetical protein